MFLPLCYLYFIIQIAQIQQLFIAQIKKVAQSEIFIAKKLDMHFYLCYYINIEIRTTSERKEAKMVNILKLKGKIVEKGFNVERLAESTEVSKHVLYQRLKKSEDFTVKEVVAIVT